MRYGINVNNRIKIGMRRTAVSALVTVLIGSMLTGCGLVDMPELTDEQTELVTEYAAGLILKYDMSAPQGELLNEEDLATLEAQEAEKRRKEREAKAAAEDYLAKKANAEKEKKEAKDMESNDSESSKKKDEDTQVGDLAQFYGIDGFSISYKGYELTDSYPTSGEDLLMAMDATDGKQLCVLKFDVTNNSGSEQTFDMFYRNPNFYLMIDGGEKIHQQYTLLLDDMAASNDKMAAGETFERVLIFEVPDSIDNIGSMTMQAKNSEGVKGTMILK